MKRTSIASSLLIWSLNLAFASGATAQVSESVSANFGRIEVTKLLVMPDTSGHVDWNNAIDGARTSVHMMMYHLTDKEVINAIAAKKQKSPGVEIKIIVDGKSLKGGYAKAIETLTQAGVEVRPSSKAFSITHAKSMILDGKSAFITAINLTNTATNSRDFGVVTPDAAIIREMESVFQADWENAQTNADTTPMLTNSNLAWSPNNSQAKLVALVDSAKKSLDAEVESFSSDDIIAAMNRAVARGVNVRLIVPECIYGNATFNYQYLAKLVGVNAHTEHNGMSVEQPYMHSKMMVADGETMYVGSINYSFNSILKARELGVIFQNNDVSRQLSSEFEKDWKRSDTPNASNCQKEKERGGSDAPLRSEAEL
jgi:cardiolipin synthase A/B